MGINEIINQDLRSNIVAAFRGMHVSPAKHSYAWLPRKCDYRTDIWTDRQTLDKVIPMCHYALQATQKCLRRSKALHNSNFALHNSNFAIKNMKPFVWELGNFIIKRIKVLKALLAGLICRYIMVGRRGSRFLVRGVKFGEVPSQIQDGTWWGTRVLRSPEAPTI